MKSPPATSCLRLAGSRPKAKPLIRLATTRSRHRWARRKRLPRRPTPHQGIFECPKCCDAMQPIIYWIDHSGPGRLAILARPQGDDALDSEIRGWREAGIDVVVSLLTEADNSYLGLSAEAELCRSNGLEFIGFPIQDFGVPDSPDETLQLVRKLNDLLTKGKNIGF